MTPSVFILAVTAVWLLAVAAQARHGRLVRSRMSPAERVEAEQRQVIYDANMADAHDAMVEREEWW